MAKGLLVVGWIEVQGGGVLAAYNFHPQRGGGGQET